MRIATGFQEQNAKRQVIIDGQANQSQQGLDDYLRILWYLPQMARLFQEGRSARLKMIDRIVASFDKSHYGRLNAYERQMRERMILLMRGKQDAWLETLEKEISMRAIAIAAQRRQIILRLSEMLLIATG